MQWKEKERELVERVVNDCGTVWKDRREKRDEREEGGVDGSRGTRKGREQGWEEKKGESREY